MLDGIYLEHGSDSNSRVPLFVQFHSREIQARLEELAPSSTAFRDVKKLRRRRKYGCADTPKDG